MNNQESIKGIIISRLKRYVIKYRLFLIIFAVLAILLKAFPRIDLVISNLFYIQGDGFHLAETPAAMTVYNAVNYVTVGFIVAYVLILFINFVRKKNFFGISKKMIIFLLITLILGPGIIVNALLKEQVGRPRPAAIIEFGGSDTFVAPFTISNACESNCSFVSGHSALGFYFMAFAFLTAGVMRKRLLVLGFGVGVIVSFVRILQGRHFFSDTLFAFFFVYLAITLVYELMTDDDTKAIL